MSAWLAVVDLTRALVFSAAHLCGGSLGTGVLAVSIVVRLALLPMTLRMARRARAHQLAIEALAPEIARLKNRHASDPGRIGQETLALYQKKGIGLAPRGTLASMLVQFPVGAAMYQAVSRGLGQGTRFLWIGDLARPDMIVASAAAGLAGFAAATGASTQARTAFAMSAVITFVIAWRMSATVGLYWLASNAVGAAQSIVIRREGATRR